MDETIRIRTVAADDWDGIAALEATAYTEDGLSEGREVLESRGRPSPSTCFVVECEGRLGGYLLALPYPRFQAPDLSRAEEFGFDSANLHIHDVVVAEEFRGKWLAPRLLERLAQTAVAQGFEQISMVAVGSTPALLKRGGFSPYPEVVLPASYGTHGIYMSITLRPPGPRSP